MTFQDKHLYYPFLPPRLIAKRRARFERKAICSPRPGRLIPADDLKYLYPGNPKPIGQEHYGEEKPE